MKKWRRRRNGKCQRIPRSSEGFRPLIHHDNAATSKTVEAEEIVLIRAATSASVTSSKRGAKRPSEPAQKEEHDPEPMLDTAEQSSPLPVPVLLSVFHPSIFSEEDLLTYAINAIHPDLPPDPSPPVEQVTRK
jgi:hypothetical protein